MTTKVDLAVPCSYWQSSDWWRNVMVELLNEQKHGNVDISCVRTSSIALPDEGKNDLIDMTRHSKTDTNRNALVYPFLNDDSDWIMWLDDDTIPPPLFITRLLEAQQPFVAGIYHVNNKYYHPLAYYRMEDGYYRPLVNYVLGELHQVDAVGMGCTLVHKDVYRKIFDEHELFSRYDGTIIPIHKDKIIQSDLTIEDNVVDGEVMKIKVKHVDKNEYKFPYYMMEYARTEDFFFCELAEHVGYKPFIDTNVQCIHLKTKEISYEDYRLATMKTGAEETE